MLLAIYEEPRNILLFILYTFFKYMQAFKSALPFLLSTFLLLFGPSRSQLRSTVFLKNAVLTLPFGQSLPEEIKFPFFSSLASLARCLGKKNKNKKNNTSQSGQPTKF